MRRFALVYQRGNQQNRRPHRSLPLWRAAAAADGRLRAASRGGPWSLEEAENSVSVDAEADHAGATVDLRDRVGRDEAAAAREEARADRDRIRHVRRGAVHRRLDGAHDAAL